MPSKTTTLAKAVQAALTDAVPGTFAETFVADRLYQPAWELEALEAFRLAVMPREVTRTPASRSQLFKDALVDVAIVRHLPDGCDPSTPQGTAILDAWDAFAEQVADFFGLEATQVSIHAACGARWVTTQHVLWDTQRLTEARVYFSLITLSFKYI